MNASMSERDCTSTLIYCFKRKRAPLPLLQSLDLPSAARHPPPAAANHSLSCCSKHAAAAASVLACGQAAGERLAAAAPEAMVWAGVIFWLALEEAQTLLRRCL